jgi:hypothetical protein
MPPERSTPNILRNSQPDPAKGTTERSLASQPPPDVKSYTYVISLNFPPHKKKAHFPHFLKSQAISLPHPPTRTALDFTKPLPTHNPGKCKISRHQSRQQNSSVTPLKSGTPGQSRALGTTPAQLPTTSAPLQTCKLSRHPPPPVPAFLRRCPSHPPHSRPSPPSCLSNPGPGHPAQTKLTPSKIPLILAPLLPSSGRCKTSRHHVGPSNLSRISKQKKSLGLLPTQNGQLMRPSDPDQRESMLLSSVRTT